jgi:hypothetical protein
MDLGPICTSERTKGEAGTACGAASILSRRSVQAMLDN